MSIYYRILALTTLCGCSDWSLLIRYSENPISPCFLHYRNYDVHRVLFQYSVGDHRPSTIVQYYVLGLLYSVECVYADISASEFNNFAASVQVSFFHKDLGCQGVNRVVPLVIVLSVLQRNPLLNGKKSVST